MVPSANRSLLRIIRMFYMDLIHGLPQSSYGCCQAAYPRYRRRLYPYSPYGLLLAAYPRFIGNGFLLRCMAAGCSSSMPSTSLFSDLRILAADLAAMLAATFSSQEGSH